MRIITGSKRGKKLISLEGDQVRPTTDRVKESLFNILQFGIEGRSFLDLFAGSGQIGLEALSRGASRAVFVDSSRASVRVVLQNVEATGFADRAQVVTADFQSFLAGCRDKFDVAFLDPPYREGLLETALPLTVSHMNSGGVVVCEHPKEEALPETAEDFSKVKSYRYGKTALTVYRKAQGGSQEKESR